MSDPFLSIILAVTGLAGLGIVAATGLRGWNGWLDLKRMELDRHRGDVSSPSAGARIEVADLKERIRKLEAIAAGVDI